MPFRLPQKPVVPQRTAAGWRSSLASRERETELIRPTTPGRRIRVSQGAEGRAPRWRGDAGEFFYVAADGWMTAITVGSGDPPALGAPQPLFRVDLSVEDGYDAPTPE